MAAVAQPRLHGRAGQAAIEAKIYARRAMSEDVEAFLPTVERARAAGLDLPTNAPFRLLAAVTVAARAETRQAFDQTMEVSLALAERLPREPPPLAGTMVTATHRCLASESAPRACSHCAFKPGFTDCVACGASGRLGPQHLSICMACEGEGWVRCPTCDGSRMVVNAVIRRVEDRDYALRHTFVPESAAEFAARVVQELVDDDPPEALRFDLDARTAIAPYRTADQTPRRGSFLDYEYEESAERARAAVEHLTLKETLVRCEVRSWARPFLLFESGVVLGRGTEWVFVR